MKSSLAILLLSLTLSFSACSSVGDSCENDVDCTLGSVCINGICEGGDECFVDNDCSDPAAVCVDGVCVEP